MEDLLSFFETELSFIAAKREIRFTPSATGWTDMVNLVYVELRNDKNVQILRELPIEALRYYAACLFWIRAISLKKTRGDELTTPEEAVDLTFAGKTLAIPEPILLGLMCFGRVETRCGEVLQPVFCDIPVTVTQNIPGGLGVVDGTNHNFYEELPIIGPAYQSCLLRAASHERNSNPASAFAPTHTAANVKLQGYGPLSAVRPDQLFILHTMGFTGKGPNTIKNSGINYNAVKTVSNLISCTSTFKIQELNLTKLSPTGSIAMIVETHPLIESLDAMTFPETEVTAQAYSKESKTSIGESLTFGLNHYKENSVDEAHPTDMWDRIKLWSCITYSEAHPPPEGYADNRNAMRNLPSRFKHRVFYTANFNTSADRKTVVSRLAGKT